LESSVLLVAFGLLLPLALAARMAAGRWLRPGAMFAGYWAIAGIAPLLLFETPRVGVIAIVYIAVAVVLFSLGAMVAGGFGGPTRVTRPVVRLNRKLVMPAIWVGTGAGFIAGLLTIRENGLSVATLLSFDGVLETGNTIAVQRYSGQSASYAVAGLLAVTYASALVAPYARVLDPTLRRWWLLAPVISALFYSTVTTGKLALLIAGACTICGFIAATMLRTGDAPKVTRRGVVVTLAAACAIFAAFTAITFIRLGHVDSGSVPVVREKLSTYAFGYEPGFSEWLGRYESAHRESMPLGWGTASVAGLSVLTGQSRGDTRAYEERVVINEDGVTTNIYTIFRGLLIDFGTAGAALAVFAFGLATGLAFRRATIRGSLIAAVVLGCLYAIVLMSNVMSIVSFTNVCAGMLGAACVLHLASVRSRGLAHPDQPVAVARGVALHAPDRLAPLGSGGLIRPMGSPQRRFKPDASAKSAHLLGQRDLLAKHEWPMVQGSAGVEVPAVDRDDRAVRRVDGTGAVGWNGSAPARRDG
jgi:oligosaccharide repeat unit polymerase